MKKTLFALIAAASLPAFAFNPSAEYAHLPDSSFVSTRTRAEVQAEAVQAAKDGTLARGEASYVAPTVGTPKSRAQVKEELARYVASGEAARDQAQLAGGN